MLGALAYAALTVVLLGGSIRPGRTLVPADALLGVAPYGQLQPGATAHNPLPSDAPLQFHPLLEYFAGEVRDGRLPQWNPRTLGGTVMSPNGYFATHYPAVLLVRWLDPFDVYNLFVALHLVVGALGCYALARRLGAPPVPAWVAGTLALTAAVWVHWSLHLGHLVGMVWLPVVLAAVHLAAHRPSPGSAAAVAGSFGLWWLGGNPQFCYYGTLVLGGATVVFLVARWRAERRPADVRDAAVAVGGGLLLGLAIAAPTLLPTVAVADDVIRSREPVTSMSATHLRAPELAELLVPDIGGSPVGGVVYRPERFGGHQMDTPFVGVTTLVLAVVAVAGAPRRRRTAGALLVLGAAATFLAFSGPPHRLLHGALPGYDRFRASSRWLAVVPALVVPVAALGLASLLEAGRRARAAALAASAVAAAGIVAVALSVLSDPSAPKRFMTTRLVVAAVPVAGCALAALAVGRRRRLALALVAATALAEVAFQLPRWYPSVREETAYPSLRALEVARERGGRLLRVGPVSALPSVPPNVPMAYGVDDAQGQAVLFPDRVDRYLRTIEDYGTFAIASNTAPPVTDPSSLSSPAVRALDVRTVLVDGPPPAAGAAELLDDGAPPVYATPSTGPAVVVVDARPASEDAMWAAVADPGWDPARTAAVVGLPRRVSGVGGDARAVRRNPADEVWSVTAAKGGLLRVSGAWHEGWSATVDGRPSAVLQADGLYRSVVVPPGDHVVRFRFRNSAEEVGRALAAAALTVLGALGAFAWWRRRTAGPVP